MAKKEAGNFVARSLGIDSPRRTIGERASTKLKPMPSGGLFEDDHPLKNIQEINEMKQKSKRDKVVLQLLASPIDKLDKVANLKDMEFN